MSPTMDLGGDKTLKEWCREMNAEKCLSLIGDPATEERDQGTEEKDSAVADTDGSENLPSKPLVRRLSSEIDEANFTQNRLEELDTLAIGLSTYLDNLAEEVSVCHGLLLMGNGASALASHVRSLNDRQDFLQRDLEDRNNQWAIAEKALALHMQRSGKTEEDLKWKDSSICVVKVT